MAYIGAGITRFNTADGLTVKGTAEFTDTVVLGDSDELRFGAGEDLKIYHDASNSYIQDAGTGALILRSNSFQAKSADNTTTMFTGAESGAVELYYNNVKRIETTGSGANVTGTVTADGLTVDASAGGLTFSGGGDTFISATSSPLIFKTSSGTERMRITGTGRVGIGTSSPDGTAHIHTASAGSVTANTDADDLTVENSGNSGISILSPDANRSAIMFGHVSDNLKMQIRHDGSTSLSQIISDDAVTFNVIGGTERMRINDTGIGIGTASPSSGLHLSGAATSNARMTFTQTTASATGKIQQGSTAFTISSDGALPMTFDINGAEAARLDASRNLLVGTTTEGISDYGDTLTIADSDHCGMTIRSGTSSEGNVYFSDGTSGDAEYKGIVKYEHSSNDMSFWSNSLRRMTIDSSGNVGIGTTSPGGELEVYRAGTSEVLIGTDNGGTAQLSLYENNDGTKEGLLKYDGFNNRIHLATSGAPNALVIPRDSGNVGIGTDSPQQLLSLKANNPGGKIRLEMGQTGVANNDVTGEIQFYHNDASGAGVNADIKGICTSSVGAGALTFGTGTTSTTERMRIDSSGNLLIGATTVSGPDGGNATGIVAAHNGRFYISSLNGANVFEFNITGTGGVGSINVSGSSTSYNTSSDYRLKENVADMTGAIDRVKALAPKRFNFIADADTTVDGFLAHEAQAVVPEAVTGTHNEVDDDGNAVMQGIDQSKLVPLLTGALQEAIAKIETLETEVAALKAAN